MLAGLPHTVTSRHQRSTTAHYEPTSCMTHIIRLSRRHISLHTLLPVSRPVNVGGSLLSSCLPTAMSAPAAAVRSCIAVILLALLLLVHADLAVCQSQFHLIFATPPDGLDYFGLYSARYDLILTATETPADSGRWNITAVEGTRTYSDRAGDVTIVKVMTYRLPMEHFLYYPPTSPYSRFGGYIDFHGIGFTLEQPQTIFPGVDGRVDVGISAGIADGQPLYGENTESDLSFNYTCVVTPFTAPKVGDSVTTGFHDTRFLVHGPPHRVYNVLSLPSLQVNARFIPPPSGAAIDQSEQGAEHHHHSKPRSVLKEHGAGAAHRLPSTQTWSHDGMYMGETGVQLAGHRLLVRPGEDVSGFEAVQLDGAELAVSSEAVLLPDGSTILRSSLSVVKVTTAHASFSLINGDHFVNIHSAQLTLPAADSQHTHGSLGQPINSAFTAHNTAALKQHMEAVVMLPEGENVWSTRFEHNRYVHAANTSWARQRAVGRRVGGVERYQAAGG